MGGATMETGAPENRIDAHDVLTPRARGLQTRFLDSWSPPAEKLPPTRKKASAGFEQLLPGDSKLSRRFPCRPTGMELSGGRAAQATLPSAETTS